MTDKSTEDMLREQAQAVLKVQEEALKTQMQMMESLYGDNPEMLAMMKAQIQQSLANQSALVEQAQTAAFEAVAAAQRGEGFDPQALVSTLQQNAQSMGYGLPVKTDADREEGYAQALNFIGQLQTEFTEPPARSVPRGSREARVFGYLLGGIVGTLNGHELEQLDPEAHEPFYEEQVRSILSDYWGVDTAEELEERLADLLEEGGMSAQYGHYGETENFDEIASELDPEDVEGETERWKFARYARTLRTPEAMRAWDIGRAASLVRWGHFVGMLDEETAESILEACAEEACARFEGWRDFGASYLFGGLFWRLNAGEGEAAEWLENAGGACAELLDTEGDTEGEWQRNPWVARLTD